MQRAHTDTIMQVIGYVERNLNNKLELETVAAALHYSKFHLHRMFAQTVGLTIHDYAGRRRLTEGAKLLAFSRKPILEIALESGFESQQAFTSAFKAMYKTTPAKFRKSKAFYPLQWEIRLHEEVLPGDFRQEDICLAGPGDVDDWMELVGFSVDGYPCLDEGTYLENLKRRMSSQEALILRDGGRAAGVLAFWAEAGSVEFLAVHPQYRNRGVGKLLLDKLQNELLCGREITVTTYRAGDKADTGYRKTYADLGFAEGELLVEYGYPTQRFARGPRAGVAHD
ncbi:MAG: GNAT family N-acetyltransferase [Lachnospiraceae bacterium]|nr:GNAT family N-acetyltransferase [Lachnospiraceae bacterium]